MKTNEFVMLLVQLAVLSALSVGCTPVAYPVGTPNPLDVPGVPLPTAGELHRENLAEITGNPAYQ